MRPTKQLSVMVDVPESTENHNIQLVELKKIGLGEKLFEAFMKRNVWEVV